MHARAFRYLCRLCTDTFQALLLPAWLLCSGFVAVVVYSVEGGLDDRHLWDVRFERFEELALVRLQQYNFLTFLTVTQLAWIGSFLFLVGNCLLKLSILLFYRRIQKDSYDRRWMIAVWTATAFTIAYSLAFLFALIFSCTPVQAYWKTFDFTWARQYHCRDTLSINILVGVFSVISDIYAVLLPCLMLRKLKISRRKKIGLNAVFALGLLVVAAGCGRIFAFHHFSTSYDSSWKGFEVYVWSVAEYDLGIICACLPSLRVFIKRWLNKYHSTYNSQSKQSGSGPSWTQKHRERNNSDTELTSLEPPPAVAQRIETTVAVSSDSPDAQPVTLERCPTCSKFRPKRLVERPSRITSLEDYEQLSTYEQQEARRSPMMSWTRARGGYGPGGDLPPRMRGSQLAAAVRGEPSTVWSNV